VVGIALWVLAERGRVLQREITAAAERVETASLALKEHETAIEDAVREVEAADVAISEAVVAGLTAQAEHDVISQKWQAERDSDEARTRAAIARKDHVYYTDEKSFANGHCWVEQRPDKDGVISRLAGPPSRERVIDAGPASSAGAPDESTRAHAGTNGTSNASAADIARVASRTKSHE
jgi:hypothetical protein